MIPRVLPRTRVVLPIGGRDPLRRHMLFLATALLPFIAAGFEATTAAAPLVATATPRCNS